MYVENSRADSIRPVYLDNRGATKSFVRELWSITPGFATSKQSLSKRIVSCVHLCYQKVNKSLPGKPKAHSTRSKATTAFLRNIPISQNLQSNSLDIFLHFYEILFSWFGLQRQCPRRPSLFEKSICLGFLHHLSLPMWFRGWAIYSIQCLWLSLVIPWRRKNDFLPVILFLLQSNLHWNPKQPSLLPNGRWHLVYTFLLLTASKKQWVNCNLGFSFVLSFLHCCSL